METTDEERQGVRTTSTQNDDNHADYDDPWSHVSHSPTLCFRKYFVPIFFINHSWSKTAGLSHEELRGVAVTKDPV